MNGDDFTFAVLALRGDLQLWFCPESPARATEPATPRVVSESSPPPAQPQPSWTPQPIHAESAPLFSRVTRGDLWSARSLLEDSSLLAS